MKEYLTMSNKELERYRVLTLVLHKKLSQVKASELLNITDRQIRNLLKTLNKEGPKGLISKKRSSPSNRCIDSTKKLKIMKIVSDKYPDFTPTFATEKLQENHNINISRETLRQWMIAVHLWIPNQKARKKHQLRQRRQYFGELIQGDGSFHDWFEGRRDKCVLLVFIDDATSKITCLKFCEREGLEGYFEILKDHLEKYGKPLALYTDRFSVFEATREKESLTQFKRALNALNIEWIGAKSPQAKGRVERCNRTLQDRLIKEMRLRNISDIEHANAYLEEFIEHHNNKFSKEPMKTTNLHRPLEQEVDLHRTLSRFEERTLTKDLIFQYNSTHFKISDPTIKCFSGQKIEIRSKGNEEIRVYVRDKEVEVKPLHQIYEETTKELHWESREDWRQKKDHPWKQHEIFLQRRKKELKNIKWYNGIKPEISKLLKPEISKLR